MNAGDRGRTCKAFRPREPKSRASANSATPARRSLFAAAIGAARINRYRFPLTRLAQASRQLPTAPFFEARPAFPGSPMNHDLLDASLFARRAHDGCQGLQPPVSSQLALLSFAMSFPPGRTEEPAPRSRAPSPQIPDEPSLLHLVARASRLCAAEPPLPPRFSPPLPLFGVRCPLPSQLPTANCQLPSIMNPGPAFPNEPMNGRSQPEGSTRSREDPPV